MHQPSQTTVKPSCFSLGSCWTVDSNYSTRTAKLRNIDTGAIFPLASLFKDHGHLLKGKVKPTFISPRAAKGEAVPVKDMATTPESAARARPAATNQQGTCEAKQTGQKSLQQGPDGKYRLCPVELPTQSSPTPGMAPKSRARPRELQRSSGAEADRPASQIEADEEKFTAPLATTRKQLRYLERQTSDPPADPRYKDKHGRQAEKKGRLLKRVFSDDSCRYDEHPHDSEDERHEHHHRYRHSAYMTEEEQDEEQTAEVPEWPETEEHEEEVTMEEEEADESEEETLPGRMRSQHYHQHRSHSIRSHSRHYSEFRSPAQKRRRLLRRQSSLGSQCSG